jgi:hypothetical protein
MSTQCIDDLAFCAISNSFNDGINYNITTAYSPIFKIAVDYLSEKVEENYGSGYHFQDDVLLGLANQKLGDSVIDENDCSKEVKFDGEGLDLELNFSKDLPFAKPYYISEEPFTFGDSKLCHFRPEKLSLMHYADENDFAIELLPENTNHEIIMIKKPFNDSESFADIFENYQKQMVKVQLDFNASVKIPIIELDWKSNHPEIKNRIIVKSDSDFIEIKSINEEVKFCLSNIGAKVEVTVSFATKWSMAFPKNPQKIIFDKPFVVFLKKKDAEQPYFAGYFLDATYLKKFNLSEVQKENEKVNDLITSKSGGRFA